MFLRDFQHAARLYVDNAYALAPKNKFLYYVNFNLTDSARALSPELANKYQAEINMLCKTVDLPQYSSSVEVKNQYNRKKLIQTRIDYTPTKISMHDDNLGVSTLMLETYYRYYFKDTQHAGNANAYRKDNLYKGDDAKSYGLETAPTEPFFNNIKIYQLSRQQFTEFTLVNPVIERWGHDTMDQTDGTGILENSLEINYEAVYYSRGTIDVDNPATFATRRYDVVDSPLGGREYINSAIADPWNNLSNTTPPPTTVYNPSLPPNQTTPSTGTTSSGTVATPANTPVKVVPRSLVNRAVDVATGEVLSAEQLNAISAGISEGVNYAAAVIDKFNAQTGANT